MMQTIRQLLFLGLYFLIRFHIFPIRLTDRNKTNLKKVNVQPLWIKMFRNIRTKCNNGEVAKHSGLIHYKRLRFMHQSSLSGLGPSSDHFQTLFLPLLL